MLLPTGALRDDSKNVCEGDYTLYEYRNPFFFTCIKLFQILVCGIIFILQLIIIILYLLHSIWKSWMLSILLII